MTECLIDNVAFGGDGVARKDGLVIFAPFTLPGEVVELEIYKKKSNFANAHLQKVLKPSPHRIPAPCPYFGSCGGCALQHSSYPYQLELKKKFVEDSLSRIGKINFSIPSVVPSTDPFSYRRHISLQIEYTSNIWQLCFKDLSNRSLPINSCLLFHLPKDPILADLQKVVAKLDLIPSCEGRAKILKVDNGYVIAFTFSHNLSKKNISLLSSCKTIPSVLGIILHMPQEQIKFGDFSLTFTCHGLTFAYSPFSFLQNHAEQSSRIYLRLLSLLQDSTKILDLYCGIGVSTLLLAKAGKQVTGIEINPEAIRVAKENALLNNLSSVSFFCSSVDSSTENLMNTCLPDALLVNPPRTGLDPIVKQAFTHPCLKKIVYVSCHPPTLARDLSYLQQIGFSLQSVESFDMFPQTTHVETIACLTR
ncbi:MAG: 23S rRNA (uracil(1939)-C(5))-methyltransferase RlmD [Verrucomicrobia bacterium]|nr:23S rRNA (uracil(1939)-C(5))-methyltransferase RlmD [Verrucomicrobiota bacterium]